MKVLVKGNVIARKNIYWWKPDQLHYNVSVSEEEEKAFDLIFYGDLNVDSIFAKDAEVYATGNIVALGEE